MKEIHLRCKKCQSLLDKDEEMRRGLCSRCERSGVRRLRARFKEERSSLLDDFLDPLGLENLGE